MYVLLIRASLQFNTVYRNKSLGIYFGKRFRIFSFSHAVLKTEHNRLGVVILWLTVLVTVANACVVMLVNKRISMDKLAFMKQIVCIYQYL